MLEADAGVFSASTHQASDSLHIQTGSLIFIPDHFSQTILCLWSKRRRDPLAEALDGRGVVTDSYGCNSHFRHSGYRIYFHYYFDLRRRLPVAQSLMLSPRDGVRQLSDGLTARTVF